MSICSQTGKSCPNSWDNQVKLWYFPPLHAPLVLCQTLAWLKSACWLKYHFSLLSVCLSLTELLSQQSWLHQTPCWCPVCWTNYGSLCSFYGNLCHITLWSFLRAVVLNMQQDGDYVAMARCLYLHGVYTLMCMFTVILLVLERLWPWEVVHWSSSHTTEVSDIWTLLHEWGIQKNTAWFHSMDTDVSLCSAQFHIQKG